jgi:hypothetical protein
MQPNSNAESLFQAVVRDTSNNLLLSDIAQILRDPQRLLETAQGSYRHQLGFLKMALRNDISGCALRLHVWDRGAIVLEDIHSHCAGFMSRVVSGEIEESCYELTPGRNLNRFRYRFDAHAGHAVAQVDGLTNVFQTSQRPLLAGSIYQRSSHELHTVRNIVANTVTVSAWGVRSSEAIVIKPLGARAEDCGAIAGMSPDQVKTLLMDIYGRLHAGT